MLLVPSTALDFISIIMILHDFLTPAYSRWICVQTTQQEFLLEGAVKSPFSVALGEFAAFM